MVVLLLKTNHQKSVLEASDWVMAVLCIVHLVNLSPLHLVLLGLRHQPERKEN